jgi:lipopolysaccharide transport system permease protein
MINVSLILELTKRDFSDRFAGSILGSVWALIWPLVSLFIYIAIFGKLMGAKLPGSSEFYAYSIYLTVGLLPWTAFSNSIYRSTSVFIDTKHLISKVKLSLPSLLIYIILSETITYVIAMMLFFVFLFVSGYQFNARLILLPYLFYLQQLFAFGFGLCAATVTVFIRDLKEVIGIMLQLWFWFTPIVYIQDILPEFLKKIMVYNPAHIIISSYRSIFVFNDAPWYGGLIALTVITHVIIFLAYLLFRSLEKDVRDFL